MDETIDTNLVKMANSPAIAGSGQAGTELVEQRCPTGRVPRVRETAQ
jgi:hypothetical protein